MHELLLLLGLAGTPVADVELVDKGFVDVVDDRVEGEDSVFTDLAEQNFVVVGTGGGNGLACWHGATHEVDTLTLDLFLFTYKRRVKQEKEAKKVKIILAVIFEIMRKRLNLPSVTKN